MNIENHDNVCKEEVFSFLFNAHSKAIFRSIFYKYGNEEKAYDVVQEAFVKLWEHCAKVTPGKAKSYVYTIANNNYLNVLKAEKVRLKYNNSGLENDRTQESPEYLMEEKEFQQKLDNALNSLPENQRQTFLMNRVEGKKYAEIADLEGVSVKAIEKRMHLALKTLRETIDGI
ncbi:RNA polymerase sigma factor [Zeaxanthinibacter enoshimensis]|uniref:RNA polymerase sigma-70 factor (ECF subfamily) n=1 Tax=Zeaxanthinibacter enoshimensis TaxID=392009 RepID=A0A4R6TIJ4_9FLAO|nr:sigma-70 family RNA polymerase sigma factor [Zeaxanthinibacter enoshimensis]TDQ29036.1 RNA polymerase sigma-70 factor (ECF subfamily) [Zeaxanthinibacter enoshimensis]